MIHTKILLFATLPIIFMVYFFFLPINKIVNIILDEYILIFITMLTFILYKQIFKKISKKTIYELIPNIDHVPIKSTVIFFLIFEIIDFYYEDGFIGMISLWFMYWLFALEVYLVTHIINLYKNQKLHH